MLQPLLQIFSAFTRRYLFQAIEKIILRVRDIEVQLKTQIFLVNIKIQPLYILSLVMVNLSKKSYPPMSVGGGGGEGGVKNLEKMTWGLLHIKNICI